VRARVFLKSSISATDCCQIQACIFSSERQRFRGKGRGALTGKWVQVAGPEGGGAASPARHVQRENPRGRRTTEAGPSPPPRPPSTAKRPRSGEAPPPHQKSDTKLLGSSSRRGGGDGRRPASGGDLRGGETGGLLAALRWIQPSRPRWSPSTTGRDAAFLQNTPLTNGRDRVKIFISE